MNTEINPVDELLPVIALAIENWKLENTAEKLIRTVTQQLNTQAENIVLCILGFEKDTWNRESWKLDQCNGRAATTQVGVFIHEHQSAAIKDWLSKVAMPQLSPKMTAAMQKACQEQYQGQFEYALRQAVQRKATADAEAMVNDIVKSKQIENYLKVLKLINPEPVTQG